MEYFIFKLGDILIDVGKIFFGGIVIGAIMDNKTYGIDFIIVGAIFSICAFAIGLILQTITKGGKKWAD